MAEFNNIGDTIEGQKASGTARKWIPKGLKKHPILQNTMFYYVTDRNSSVEVTEAGVEPDDKHLKDKTAHHHRNVGDKVIGDSLSIYINQKTPVKAIVKEGVSGRHGASTFTVNKQTIASIKVPLMNALKQLGYSPNSIKNKE